MSLEDLASVAERDDDPATVQQIEHFLGRSTPAKRPRGRPRIRPIGEKRINATTQIASELHDKLKSAAVASGISVSRELERRLEMTFEASSLADMVERLVRERLSKA